MQRWSTGLIRTLGDLVTYLDERGELENTLILFFSDNGACPYQRLRSAVKPGPAESDTAYDARWANMCNAPLRLYKQYAHEGGTSTPMIAHWPQQITNVGAISRYTSHLVDLMPTVVELAGATYPSEYAGQSNSGRWKASRYFPPFRAKRIEETTRSFGSTSATTRFARESGSWLPSALASGNSTTFLRIGVRPKIFRAASPKK